VVETESPCRLFLYLAQEAPIGVVLRRGPSDWARLSLWYTDSDTFEHGQWIHARVYERRCDLSADGALFAAFVRDSAGPNQAHTDTWVTVSRPPWFTALALWFIGGTYYTGGLFVDGRTLWLGFDPEKPDQGQLPSWLKTTTALPPYVDRTNDWTDRTIWINRLLRGGWSRGVVTEPETWERRNPGGDMTLVMVIWSALEFGAYGGRHDIEFVLRRDSEGSETSLGRATWADWDQRGRLVLAHDGRLWHWESSGTLQELADFNPQAPNPEPSPAWAREWPARPAQRLTSG
jgi:hypothetical protein